MSSFKLFDNKNLKFNLNKYDCNINDNFDITINESENPNSSKEEYGYNADINMFRDKIDNINNDIWKKIRWYINKYDFTINGSIINRAFYKYWEMVNEFDIFNDYDSKSDIILHCAEAPGGFIQGSNIFLNLDDNNTNTNNDDSKCLDEDGFMLVKRKHNKKHHLLNSYRIYTMSLNRNYDDYKKYNLPSYNKNVINKYVHVLNGADNTGDLNNLDNIDYIDKNVKNKFYLITCDGGFDEGINFNNKEQLHYQLILNEIYSSIKLQKYDGHFILKMFDIFTDASIHLLYLLTLCYRNVWIYKPLTSRPTNSEKYIICKYFNCNESNRKMFLENIKKISVFFAKSKANYKCFKLFKTIPDEFINEIYDINTNIVKRQCDFLKEAIELCNDSFIDNYNREYTKSMNERKKIFDEWMMHYKLNGIN
jgi:23S rRNA U2552 (ribose-2'-O)-methylase RlmE/FtsJ